jgi:hypothetical protein
MTMARYWSEVIKRFSISQVPLMDLGFSDKAKTCLSEVSCLSAESGLRFHTTNLRLAQCLSKATKPAAISQIPFMDLRFPG